MVYTLDTCSRAEKRCNVLKSELFGGDARLNSRVPVSRHLERVANNLGRALFPTHDTAAQHLHHLSDSRMSVQLQFASNLFL
jgi:hypothetical protein